MIFVNFFITPKKDLTANVETREGMPTCGATRVVNGWWHTAACEGAKG